MRTEAQERYYTSEKGRASASRCSRRARLRRQAFLNIWKHAAGCADCGFRENVAALDFDHVRGEKLFDVGAFNGAMEKLMAEIAKCEVVCANHHRIRTVTRAAS